MISGLMGRAFPVLPPGEDIRPGDTMAHFVVELALGMDGLRAVTVSYLFFMKWMERDVFKIVLVELKGTWNMEKIIDLRELTKGIVMPPKITVGLDRCTPFQAIEVFEGLVCSLVRGEVVADLLASPGRAQEWTDTLDKLREATR